ncbi:MAG: helix-turn-helix transcriptional regulator [Bacteroidales bacterium]|nr:helix-turn-helix transcriptional regulator [Bacteroidales bacterium]
MRKVKAIIGRVNAGTYVYSVVMDADEVPFGLNGTGKTVEEAKQDMLDAYAEIQEIMAEKGESYEELLFEYVYDIPSFLAYYAHVLSLAGLERISGINQRQLSHYINGTSKPSRTTVERFRSRIRSFAEELQSADVMWR